MAVPDPGLPDIHPDRDTGPARGSVGTAFAPPALFAGVWLTACTYPVVVLVLPLALDMDSHEALYLGVAETFAPVAECALFWMAFGDPREWGQRSMSARSRHHHPGQPGIVRHWRTPALHKCHGVILARSSARSPQTAIPGHSVRRQLPHLSASSLSSAALLALSLGTDANPFGQPQEMEGNNCSDWLAAGHYR